MFKQYIKHTLCIISVLCVTAAKTFSQEKEIPKEYYIAANIPDSLKENANSVVRYSEVNRSIKGPGKEVFKVHELITILNEKADDEAVLRLDYNKKFNSVSNIEMRVYDDKGALIKKYKRSDMYDGADGNDETLVTDDRFLFVKHPIVSYPVTIEKDYEYDLSSLLDLGSWEIQYSEQAVQHASYHLRIDENAGFRYLNKNTAIKPKKLLQIV